MKAKAYSSVLMPPQYSEVDSRSLVDLTTEFGPIKLRLPIISANMKTVTGEDMAFEMHQNGGFGLLHRFCSIEENVEMLNETKDSLMFEVCTGRKQMARERKNICGVSVGVEGDAKDRFKALHEAGAYIVCIDIAHGHHIKMRKMIEFIRENETEPVTIIAGNVATEDAAFDLKDWGADIIKVGIGPGAMCITRRNTGIGVPQFHAIKSIHDAYPKIPLIADGGCRTVSDIATALAAGADTVMLGSILAGTIETPGRVYPDDSTDLVNRTYYKVYGGSASAQSKGENRFVEGKMSMIPFKGHVKYILKEIHQGLQSSISYRGHLNITEWKKDIEFLDIDFASQVESAS